MDRHYPPANKQSSLFGEDHHNWNPTSSAKERRRRNADRVRKLLLDAGFTIAEERPIINGLTGLRYGTELRIAGGPIVRVFRKNVHVCGKHTQGVDALLGYVNQAAERRRARYAWEVLL